MSFRWWYLVFERPIHTMEWIEVHRPVLEFKNTIEAVTSLRNEDVQNIYVGVHLFSNLGELNIARTDTLWKDNISTLGRNFLNRNVCIVPDGNGNFFAPVETDRIHSSIVDPNYNTEFMWQHPDDFWTAESYSAKMRKNLLQWTQ